MFATALSSFRATCKNPVARATTSNVDSLQDERYREAAREFGPAMERLARAYEADPGRREDLLQEIHLALWRSLAGYNGLCSLRTWVYRVAHNAATSHVLRERRTRTQVLVSVEELEAMPDPALPEAAAGERHALDRLLELVQQLNPLDRRIILSYLEGLDAASISEITGISAGNVATKIHRIKNVLFRRFHQGAPHAEG
jgi:RNA polymerase sigma-70 factor (ECF subfamily)